MRKLWKKINVTAVAAAVLAVTMVFSAFAAFETPAFTDVPKSHWAYTFIETAAGKGWVSGTGGGKFEPTKNLTNAEFVTMLVNAWYPDDYAEIKPNVGSAYWWTPYLHTASVVGMLMNTEVGESYFENDLEFPASAANTKISRYEMALMIANVMKQKKITVDSSELSAARNSIADYSSIPEKYKDAVTTCFAAGVLSGKGEGKFAGQDNLTRAESAAVLCNIYKLFSGEDLTGGSGTTTPDIGEFNPSEGDQDSFKYVIPADANGDGILTNDEVLAKLNDLRDKYPEGMLWGTDKYYTSPTMGYAKECAAFAYQMSDEIFGDLPRYNVSSVDDLRVGDIIWDKSTPHWAIIREIDRNQQKVYTVDGNVGGRVTWIFAEKCSTLESGINDGIYLFYSRYPK